MRRLYFFLVISICFLQCEKPKHSDDGKSLFVLMDANHTGITFSNDLTFDKDFNIYTYRNFYNGGGVAIGDINNDGLVDIYFTSNQAKNKLYLNKGDFVFEDISERAGVEGTRAWSTGVAMADVNGDGYLDIYVCNSGDIKGDNKQNELFINNGNLTFTEQAERYGLADKGFTTHAAFFDYDKDGDLDAYILNNSYQAIGSFNLRKNERGKRDSLGGHKLLRNDNGLFVDVSEAAGIYGSVIAFGLGVTVGDVNNDTWPDIYVCNDFFERDYLYINNHDGTFKEQLTESMKSISAASMGADFADINNDGKLDLFVTEMLPSDYSRLKVNTTFEDWNRYNYNIENGYYHQFTRNTLQLNNGNGTFSEVGRLAGVEATDWSWGALFFDMNNDGLRDIFVSNGIRQDLTNQDFLQYAASEEFVKTVVSGNKVDYKKLVEVIPAEPVSNFAFVNRGNLTFENQSKQLGLSEPSFSNGSAYGDLDNDGDLDLVTNNVDSKAFVYKNRTREFTGNNFVKVQLKGAGMNTQAIGAQIEVELADKTLFAEQMLTRGFESSVDPRINFGLGKDSVVKSLVVRWPSGKITRLMRPAVNQNLVLEEKLGVDTVLNKNVVKSLPLFSQIEESSIEIHTENMFNDFDRDRLLYHMISNEGPKVCVADVNSDGLQDFYMGSAKDSPGNLYIQSRDGKFRKSNEKLFEEDKVSEDCGCEFFDADNDGDQDLYVATGSTELPTSSTALIDHLYLNDGKGNFKKSEQLLPTSNFESTSVVKASDFDNDGSEDLFVGVRVQPFVYGVATNGYLLRNDGKGKFLNVTDVIAPALKGLGMITDATWVDLDNDKDEDLVIVGEWMSIKVLINDAGKFSDQTVKFGLSDTYGWWNCIVAKDVDGDGDQDLVVGNHGLNSRFKASRERPVNMYVNDFDRNGSVEQIITRWWGDKEYPTALRHDLLSQMPELKKKFSDYKSFRNAGLNDIFTPDHLKGTLTLKAKVLSSVVLLNQGGKFLMIDLPLEAQFSPLYAIAAEDLDGDNKVDLLVGGNNYRTKPEVGRYDASYGAFLKGKGDGSFEFIHPDKSGVLIHGEIRDFEFIRRRGRNQILTTRNNDGVIFLEKNK